MTEIAAGVYVHEGRVEDWLPQTVATWPPRLHRRQPRVAVIDSGGTPQLGPALAAASSAAPAFPLLRDQHARPPRPRAGHAAFAAPGTRFVGSSKFNAAMAARAPTSCGAGARFRHHGHAGAIVYATISVDETLELDLGDRRVVVQAWPTSHTDNDLTVHDPATRTLFTSDLLFVQHIPVLDGKLRGWLATLQQLAHIEADLIVPGHGPTRRAGPDAWAPQQAYLETLAARNPRGTQVRNTLSQLSTASAPEAASRWQLVESLSPPPQRHCSVCRVGSGRLRCRDETMFG